MHGKRLRFLIHKENRIVAARNAHRIAEAVE
jgi:hypothetical protein